MTTTRSRVLRWAAVALVGGGLVASAGPAHAARPPANPDVDRAVIPAGQACVFPLVYSQTGGFRVVHTRDGSTILTGPGAVLTLENGTTGDTITSRATGATSITTDLPDGSQYVQLTGGWLVILFPTDVPAGPSTTLHTGRVTYTVDPGGTWTLLSTAGRQLDVCAALS